MKFIMISAQLETVVMQKIFSPVSAFLSKGSSMMKMPAGKVLRPCFGLFFWNIQARSFAQGQHSHFKLTLKTKCQPMCPGLLPGVELW